MRVLVTYQSETGNTEKLARAIYEGIERAEKDILPLDEVKGLENFDVIFCGFPIHASSVPPKSEAFLRSVPEGKQLALFATHGSLRGGQLAVSGFYYAMSLAPKAKVIGSFGCRGRVKPSLIEALLKKPEHRAWVTEAQGAGSHPDEADLHDGQEFARWMMTKARSLTTP